MTVAKMAKVTVIPTVVYRDAHAAIEWLCASLGFERKLVVPRDDGKVAHAELTFGNGMLMLGTACDSEYGKIVRTPESLGGLQTGSAYLIVDDVDAHYRRATAAGAVVVQELRTESWRGRGYSCRDLEGHLWNVGSYDPNESQISD